MKCGWRKICLFSSIRQESGAATQQRRFTSRITKESFARAICIFLRFSSSNYKWRFFISVSEMYANQVVAQTSPRRRALLIQKAPLITNRANCVLQLLRLIQQVWHPHALKPRRNWSFFFFFLIWFKKSKMENPFQGFYGNFWCRFRMMRVILNGQIAQGISGPLSYKI